MSGPELAGQTVVVIGASAGIGFETARRARADGADVIITGRNPDRLERASRELCARSSAAFDATDPEALERFFADLPDSIDHLTLTAGGPYYAPLAELDFAAALRSLDNELLPLRLARHSVGRVVAPGFVDTPLSASILGDDLEARREQLRTTLPIRRVVGPEDVAALAVHLMSNTALTGATYDVDGGQQIATAAWG